MGVLPKDLFEGTSGKTIFNGVGPGLTHGEAEAYLNRRRLLKKRTGGGGGKKTKERVTLCRFPVDGFVTADGRAEGRNIRRAAAFSPSVNEDGGGGRRDDFECGRWIHDSLDPSPRLIDGTKLPG